MKAKDEAALNAMMKEPVHLSIIQKAMRRSEQAEARNSNITRRDSVTESTMADVVKKLVAGEHDTREELPAEMLEDHLFRKYLKRANRRVFAAMHERNIVEDMKKQGEDCIFIKVQVPNTSCVVVVALPGSLVGKKNKILRERLSAQDIVDTVNEEPTFFVPGAQVVDGKTVHFWYRNMDSGERERHPLEALSAFGFPQVVSENLQEENATLVRKIQMEQRRFVNNRGIRIPLTHPDLRQLGYQSVDFRKDTDDPQATNVTISVNDLAVAVKLDKDLRFDFEGKSHDISLIGDSVHNILLSLLYPALCAENTRNESGRQVEVSTLFRKRIAYIGFLPNGNNFSTDQARHYLEEQGGDLSVVSERRKVGTETRNSTYYRAVENDDPDASPVNMHFPLPDNKFSSKA